MIVQDVILEAQKLIGRLWKEKQSPERTRILECAGYILSFISATGQDYRFEDFRQSHVPSSPGQAGAGSANLRELLARTHSAFQVRLLFALEARRRWMKFFILAESGGLPPASDFISSLSTRWPGATARQISKPERSYVLEFSVPMADSALEGLLARTGDSMTFEGASLRDTSGFVQWCRTLVPSHLPLLFCDESMNGEVKVTPTMTAAEILEAFHASGG